MIRIIVRLAAAGVAMGIALMAAPAGAIETEGFGIDVADGEPDGRLTVDMAAGEISTGSLRLWNKGDRPLVLRLSVVPAKVASDGTASFGGDAEPVQWVGVPERVELAAGEERRVTVTVTAPRELTAERKTVAVLAEPVVAGDAPAVLQRLAVTTYLVPVEDSLIASLGWLPWIGGAALLAALVLLGARVRARIASVRPALPTQDLRLYGAG